MKVTDFVPLGHTGNFNSTLGSTLYAKCKVHHWYSFLLGPEDKIITNDNYYANLIDWYCLDTGEEINLPWRIFGYLSISLFREKLDINDIQ